MALQGKRHLGGRDPGAVVHHFDQAGTALLDRDRDRRRPGIEAVLDQFLEGGCRALDHLARGDLADHALVQQTDGHLSLPETASVLHVRIVIAGYDYVTS